MIDEKKLIKTLQDRIDLFTKQHPDQKNCEQVQVQRELIHEIELAAAVGIDTNTISAAISHAKRSGCYCRFAKVDIS